MLISDNLPIVHIITNTVYKNGNVLPEDKNIRHRLQPVINTTFTVKNLESS